MKKITTILSVFGLTATVFAQGTINWSAPGSAFIGQTNATAYSSFVASSGSPTGGTTGNTVGGATSLFYYALLTSTGLSAAPTSLSAFNSGSGTLANSWMSTGLTMTNGTAANGRVSPVGGVVANAVASNWADLSTQNIIMVGWSPNLGSTWSSALGNLNNWAAFGAGVSGNAYFGVCSSVGSQTLGTANPGTSVIGINAGQINGTAGTGSPLVMNLLQVTAVPEPSTIALAGLAGVGLLALRRRNK